MPNIEQSKTAKTNSELIEQLIGRFVISFAALEEIIIEICIYTEFDMRDPYNEFKYKYTSMKMSDRLAHISSFLKKDDYLSKVNLMWSKQQKKLQKLNDFRNELIHGIGKYAIDDEIIVNSKGKLNGQKKIKLTFLKVDLLNEEIEKINSLILFDAKESLRHIFKELRSKRIDSWNKIVKKEFQISGIAYTKKFSFQKSEKTLDFETRHIK